MLVPQVRDHQVHFVKTSQFILLQLITGYEKQANTTHTLRQIKLIIRL